MSSKGQIKQVDKISLNIEQSFEESVTLSDSLLSDLFNIHEDHWFGSAYNDTSSCFAHVALQSEGDFLGGFGFFSEDGFGLSSVTRLFSVVTSSSLSSLAFLAFLILGDLVDSVGKAFVAVGFSCLGDDNHFVMIR